MSIQERYATKDSYLAKVREYARELFAQRLLLEDDVEYCVDVAAARWDALTGVDQ